MGTAVPSCHLHRCAANWPSADDGAPGGSAALNEVTALALLNYGHYTAMRVDERRVRGLSWHLDRLMRDCRRVFDADLDPDWVRHLIRHARG
jgi:branched-subunit amino acid aminotransferase/4-amino-4-deoxychorismate lyase